MKRKRCCLVPFGLLVLAFADGFGNRFAAFKQQNRSSRRGRGGGVSLLTEEGRDGDSRIDPDPGALEEWVSRLGGAIGPVVLEETPQFGWGLHAERDVELGEKLAILPRSMCLGLAAVGSDDACEPEDNSWLGPPEVQALVQKIPRMYPDLRLGLVLLHERYKAAPSKWEPYISNLPKRFKGVPVAAFGAVDMRGMQDLVLAGKIDQRCKYMVSFIKNVLDPLTPGPDAPFGEHRVRFGDLAWATAAVSSRAFTRLCGGGSWVQESRPLLVPFMDMLNFDFDQENVKVVSAWPSASRGAEDNSSQGTEGVLVEFDEEEWEYERPKEPEIWLIATRPVAAGDSLQVKEDYSNEQRLCKYGFVDINRRRECNNMRFEKKILRAARIHAGILAEQFGSRFEQDALEPWQQRVLIELKLDGPEQDLTVHLGGDSTNGRLPVDARLLAALRVMFTRSRKEMEGKTATELGRYKTGKLSAYVEQRVLATILGLVSVYGQQWPTTLEQDEEVLYGRQVPPSFQEVLSLPPPWQGRGGVLPQLPLGHLETREVARANALKAETEVFAHDEKEGKRNGAGEEGGEVKHVYDDDDDDDENVEEGREEEREEDEHEEERAEEEGEEEEEEEEERDAEVFRLNPELSWEMSQAVAFRYAKKRTLLDLSLIARAELGKLGLVDGMLENAKIDTIRSLAEGLEDGYPVVEDDDLPMEE